jgi:hypothetical protein
MALAMGLAAPSAALAAGFALTGDYIRIGVSDDGTLGVGGGTSPGILFDSSGSGSFDGLPDYLTPGAPYEAWGLAYDGADGRTTEFVGNNGRGDHVGLLEDKGGVAFDGETWDNRAVYSRDFDDFELFHDFFFDDDSLQLNIRTRVTAKTDLENLFLSRAIDPDVKAADGDSTVTRNVLLRDGGNTLLYAEALASKTVIGLLTGDSSAEAGLGSFNRCVPERTPGTCFTGSVIPANVVIDFATVCMHNLAGKAIDSLHLYVFEAGQQADIKLTPEGHLIGIGSEGRCRSQECPHQSNA